MALNTLLLLFLLLFVSCGKQALAPKEYIRWVEDEKNGLKVTKKANDFVFRLQYKPSDYMLLLEYGDMHTDAGIFFQRKKELAAMQYYTLTILPAGNSSDVLKEGIRNEHDYFRRLEYFDGGMQQDLKLIEGRDTFPCLLYHFERNYGSMPQGVINLAFESGSSSEETERILQVNSSTPVTLSINKTAFASIPDLKIY